jgi:uncharacterized membrane protein
MKSEVDHNWISLPQTKIVSVKIVGHIRIVLLVPTFTKTQTWTPFTCAIEVL